MVVRRADVRAGGWFVAWVRLVAVAVAKLVVEGGVGAGAFDVIGVVWPPRWITRSGKRLITRLYYSTSFSH